MFSLLSRVNTGVRIFGKQRHWRASMKRYVHSMTIHYRKDIQLLLAKNEIDLYQITCEAEAQLDVNGARLTHKQDAITLLTPERVLSLVVE